MKSISHFAALLIIATLTIFSSCEQDDPGPNPNDQELITSVQVHFADSVAGTVQTFQWRDLDGPGGANPQIDTVSLKANTKYNLSIDVLDESKNPDDTITTEIRTEALAHIFLFKAIGSGFSFTQNYLDFDVNGLPLGLTNTFFTGNPASGKIRIILKHESDKVLAETTGETDLDVQFDAKFE
ncbi:MAG: hypothetical protein ABIV51_00750 [Saprospiraceae bacterium]